MLSAVLTEKGIRDFRARVKRTRPEIDAIDADLAMVMCLAWRGLAGSAGSAVGAMEDALCKAMDREAAADVPDWHRDVFGLVADIEDHAFICGFETARRMMGGGR